MISGLLRLEHLSGSKRARGMMLIWSAITLTALMALISLAVDLGRVQLAKTELQRAADAAARYAVTGLANSTQVSRAQSVASENISDGSSVSLQTTDVESGTWASGAFTPGGASPNAVRITARRTAARGNAVPLLFARVLGQASCDVSAVSIATIASTTGNGYGLEGLSGFDVQNSAVIDSYNSAGGAYTPGTAHSNAACKSNSDIDLKNSAQILGDAHPGIGHSVSTANSSSVSGSTSSLTSALSYPGVSTGAAASSNDNAAVPGAYLNASRDFSMDHTDAYTLPAGTYYFNKITLKNSAALSCSGDVTIYVTGNVDLQNSSTVTAYSDRPGNLKLRVASGASVQIKNSAQMMADIYCPDSNYDQQNSSEFCGVVVAKDVEIKNSAKFHVDESLSNSGGSGSSGAICTVK